jgi:hypothetical protein
MRRRTLLAAGATTLALSFWPLAAEPVTPDEACAIAHDAYICAYPMVENYLSIYPFALDPDEPDYKVPPKASICRTHSLHPRTRGVVTPNSDPRYSFLIVDLRTEPLVVMRATPDNQLVLVPNSQAWGKVITNMASETRRVDLVFGVSYDDDLTGPSAGT